MGWLSGPTTARQLIDEQIGADRILHTAWSTEGGQRICWVLFTSPVVDTPIIACCMVDSYTEHGARYNAVKVVTEDMGPVFTDVPDKIWRDRGDVELIDSDYAREWRQRVAAYRESWTGRVKDLDHLDVGKTVLVENYGDREFTFTGWRPHRRSETPTFDHLRIQHWRHAHYREVQES